MKIASTLLIALAIASVSNARPGRSLGIKAGPHISVIRYSVKGDFGDDEVRRFDYQTTPSGTIFLDLSFSKNITHSFLMNYYQNSGKEQVAIPFLFFSRASRTINLQYLGLGYNFKATLPIEKFTPYLAGGFSFDFLLDYEWKGVLELGGEGFYLIERDDIDKFSAQAIICIGTEYKLEKVALLMEYGFSYNIIPFYTWENSNVEYRYTSYGHTIHFGVKIPF